jgi:hypothetical protein
MMRIVLLLVGLCGVLAGCSLAGGGGGAASSPGPPPTSYRVTLLVKRMLSKAPPGTITNTECAIEAHLRAKCDFDFVQGVGDASLVTAWVRLDRRNGKWSVVPICRGVPPRTNPLCSVAG